LFLSRWGIRKVTSSRLAVLNRKLSKSVMGLGVEVKDTI
jgi:hypothetical protein